MTLPQVESSNGKHRKRWAYSEMEAQVVAYRANGGFPVPTGRRRINPYEQFSYTVVRSTK